MVIYFILIIVILIFLYCFITYNKLVSLDNKVKEAFATMDVYLKKRWDLIPNIVEVVKNYIKHENITFSSSIISSTLSSTTGILSSPKSDFLSSDSGSSSSSSSGGGSGRGGGGSW